MNRDVEHAADVGAIDGATMHPDADEATGELVHDHEHPVAQQRVRLAPKEVHAPEAGSGVADERHPRGPASARCRAIVFRQHAGHDVLVDVDPECLRDDARNPWTAEPRIARLELDDGLDECRVRPFRARAFSGTTRTRTAGGTCGAPRPDETPGASRGGERWRSFGCAPA